MKSVAIFNSVSVLTLVLAHGVWQGQRALGLDFRSLVALGIVYIVAYWVRDRFYDEKTTFFDADSRALAAKDDGLIIFGEQVEDLAHESRERRLLISLVDFGGQKYKIYLAWIVSAALAIYLQLRIGGLDVIEVGATFLIISGIYFSPFLNQRLVPLFVGFAMALYGFGRSTEFSVTLLFGTFFTSFVYALVLFRDVTPDRLNPERKFSSKKRLQSAGLLVLSAVFIFGVIDFLVPDENPFHRKPSGSLVENKNRPRLSTEKISREFAEQFVKLGERNQAAGTGPQGNEQGQPDQGNGAGPSTDGSGQGRDRQTSSRGPGPSDAETNSNSNSNSPGQAEPENQGAKAPADDQRADDNSPKPNDPSSQVAETSKDESPREPKEQALKNPEAEPSTSAGGGEGKPGGGEGKPGGGEGKPGGGEGKPGGGEGKPGGGNGTPGGEPKVSKNGKPGDKPQAAKPDSAADKKKQREKKIEDLQKDLKLPLELAKGFIFLILAGASVFALFRYLSKPKSKEEEVIRQQLSPVQKQKLQTLLQRIKARGLSPADEIVETYNALLTVFELGHHPREEWLPAEDFSNEVGKSIPSLSEPFHGVTMQFSKTLYGRKNIGLDELEKFRGEVSQVLKFFQLS